MTRKTQTIATIGPASIQEDVFERLVQTGLDIARLNFSHASYDQLSSVKKFILKFNKKYKRNVKIMMDLQGPRMRVGELGPKGLLLKENEEILFSTDSQNKSAIFINDPYLHEDIKAHHPMFLSNGEIELMVLNTSGNEIAAKVIRGGILFSRKGVNVPETDLTTRGLTPKDIADVEFGVKNNVDYIAMSFVKDALDMHALRDYIGNDGIKIIAKIERKQALSKLDEIIKASDAVMVARGDMGVEVPLEEVPIIQKLIIKKSHKHNVKSIVATQMLMSMVDHPHPTRAEISDVANAVFEGAWAVMLSDESAFGTYPVEALSYLIRTAVRIEEYLS